MTSPYTARTVSVVNAAVLFDGPVTVAATSTQLVPQQHGRSSVRVTNTGSVTVFVKPGAAATSAAFPLAAGASVTYNNTAAINAIVAAGTSPVYVTAEGRV